MKFTEEFDVDAFPFWAGAKDTVDVVRKANNMDGLQSLIEEHFAESTPTKTDINDYVWFGRNAVLDALGINEEQNDIEETEDET